MLLIHTNTVYTLCLKKEWVASRRSGLSWSHSRWLLLLSWHASLAVRSAIHQPPHRVILCQVDCFIQCEVVGLSDRTGWHSAMWYEDALVVSCRRLDWLNKCSGSGFGVDAVTVDWYRCVVWVFSPAVAGCWILWLDRACSQKREKWIQPTWDRWLLMSAWRTVVCNVQIIIIIIRTLNIWVDRVDWLATPSGCRLALLLCWIRFSFVMRHDSAGLAYLW